MTKTITGLRVALITPTTVYQQPEAEWGTATVAVRVNRSGLKQLGVGMFANTPEAIAEVRTLYSAALVPDVNNAFDGAALAIDDAPTTTGLVKAELVHAETSDTPRQASMYSVAAPNQILVHPGPAQEEYVWPSCQLVPHDAKKVYFTLVDANPYTAVGFPGDNFIDANSLVAAIADSTSLAAAFPPVTLTLRATMTDGSQVVLGDPFTWTQLTSAYPVPGILTTDPTWAVLQPLPFLSWENQHHSPHPIWWAEIAPTITLSSVEGPLLPIDNPMPGTPNVFRETTYPPQDEQLALYGHRQNIFHQPLIGGQSSQPPKRKTLAAFSKFPNQRTRYGHISEPYAASAAPLAAPIATYDNILQIICNELDVDRTAGSSSSQLLAIVPFDFTKLSSGFYNINVPVNSLVWRRMADIHIRSLTFGIFNGRGDPHPALAGQPYVVTMQLRYL